MKKITIMFLLILFQPYWSIGQVDGIFAKSKNKTITSFQKENKSLSAKEFNILLHLDFGGIKIKNRTDLGYLFSGKIQRINLYYSDFPKGKDFTELNKNRIEQLLIDLKSYETDLVNDTSIKWNLIKQTKCKNQTEATQLFHGFEIILTFPETIKLSSLAIDTSFQDFVVKKVLERNHWRDMLIVTDMTGSMSPYIHQLFLWLKLNTIDDRIKHFIFFNDGNTQLNKNKRIGKTGGIYSTKSKKYDEVENIAIRCMMSGNGGDAPENDMEALMAGLDYCPDCKQNVMIVDNASKMRDFSLIKKINQPVRVIVCGARGKINPEYLNLARETNGSIHLMEKDLYDLMKINEGEMIDVNGVKYVIRKNKFEVLKTM